MFGTNSSNRGAFLEATREAREERAAERRRDEAAIKIQATIRGWLVRCSRDQKIRDKFDELFGHDVVPLDQTPALPPALEVFQQVAHFIKIFNLEKDQKRFEIFTRYLLASMDSENLQQSYVSCGINKDLTLHWIHHMKCVLFIACKVLESLQAEVSSENRLISLYLHLLLAFTATNTWRIVRMQSFEPLRPALNKLTENIMGDLVCRGLYTTLNHVLVRGLCRGKTALRGPAVTTVVTLALRPLVAAQYSDKLLSLITIHILSVPALVHHLVTLAPEALQMFRTNDLFERDVEFVQTEQNLRIVFNTLEGSYALCLLANLVHLAYEEKDRALPKLAFPKFNFVVKRLLEKCGEYVTTKQSSLTQWHPVLGWFSRPLDQHLNESLTLVKSQLQLLWSSSIIKVMFSYLSNVVDQEPSQSDSNVNSGNAASSAASSFSNIGSFAPSNFLKKALDRKLCSTVTGGSLRSGGLRGGGCRKLGSPTVSTVAMVCSMYHTAITTLSQLRMDILTGLCYKSEMVPQLWHILLSLGPSCGIKSYLDLLSVSTKATAPEFHLLILFCDATTHVVTVLDDLEMYEQQKPFSLVDYSTMASFLNNFTYKIINNGLVDVRSVQSSALFVSVHTLLMLLYKRNSRRSYVPDTHWLIKEVRVSTFMAELERGKRTAQVLMQKMPHIIPHTERVLLFRKHVNNEKAVLGLTDAACATPHSTLITIHRSRLVEDGYRQLASLSPRSLKGMIRVRFINEQGLDEAGIDQDGVFKEFLEETLKRVFDPSLNLFRLTSEERLYPSPTSSMTENHLQLFEFTGRMLGKAVYEGIVVDCPFASFFLSQVLGEQQSALYSSIDELPSLDPELYKSMTYIKHYDGDVGDLDLTFSYDEDYLGQIINHELRPGGKVVPVTNDNKIVYIHLMAHFKMHTQIKDQTKAFIRGFRSIINPEWLSLFSIPEFQRLISGDNVAVDLKDLRENTLYYGGFHDKHRVVCWLWDILERDFKEEERALFLKFVTSCSKPPLLGFTHLEPPFSIRCVEVGDDEDTGDTIGSVIRGFFAIRKRDPVNRLPTSSTCFNLLKLPNYQRKSTLRDKLRYAITSNTGFELS
ncbi:ubiquitin-protein ligase E3B [Procambarus clarkii]|uniref:ubiquitin-protein ligase E3B n=1 Tax=Procambarus clarkii TaxID=6728 RepID=UPI001E670AE1|nr:ubiquitin-protein ligase E3B-like [Procambarus clarkii]